MEKLRFMVDFKSLNHDMIFVSIAKQLKIAKAYALMLQTRKDIIEDMTKRIEETPLQSRTRARDNSDAGIAN